MNFALVTSKPWHDELFANLKATLKGNWTRITDKSEFTAERLAEISPDWIFIPHWSYIIPPAVYEMYKCVVFHMTDLPYGRGGSPLQNLILRGHTTTMISAIKVSEGIDTGPVYLKRSVGLSGTAREIFERSALIIYEMIKEIVANNIEPVAQEGDPIVFKRRKPSEGNISALQDLHTVYDYIRMLDCDGYPAAFIETEHLRIEFSSASFPMNSNESLSANVRIFKK